MKNRMTGFLTLVAVSVAAASVWAVGRRGGGEKAGRKIDRAAKWAKDTIRSRGPMEKAGEAVDEAMEK